MILPENWFNLKLSISKAKGVTPCGGRLQIVARAFTLVRGGP